jgi:hypothetical protein
MEGIIEDSTPATTTATTTYTHKNDSEDIAIEQEQEQGDTAMNAFDDVTLDKNNVGEAEDIFGDGKKTVDDVCKSSNSSYKNGNKTEGTKVDDEFVNYDDFFGDEQPIIEDSTTSTTSTTKATEATEATETPKTPTASTTPKTVQPIDDSDIEFAPTTTTPTTATTTTAPKKPFVIGGITFEG